MFRPHEVAHRDADVASRQCRQGDCAAPRWAQQGLWPRAGARRPDLRCRRRPLLRPVRAELGRQDDDAAHDRRPGHAGLGHGSMFGGGRDPCADRRRAASRWSSSPSRSIRTSPSTTTSPIRCARRRSPRAEIDKRVQARPPRCCGLTHRLERKPSTLSGGEQQRVALGRSLIRRPKILLLDEPLTNLDAKLRHDMRAELKRLHRQFGMTIIYATPDELEALSMGEEIAVMRDGARGPAGHAGRALRDAGRSLCRRQDRLAAHEPARGDGARATAQPSTRRSALMAPLRGATQPMRRRGRR